MGKRRRKAERQAVRQIETAGHADRSAKRKTGGLGSLARRGPGRQARVPASRTTLAVLIAAASIVALGGVFFLRMAGGEQDKKGDKVTATLVTSKGNIDVRLMPDIAPETVKNFTQLATGEKEWTDPRDKKRKQTPLYDGTIFHRVIDGFMIQGGDPQGDGRGGPGYKFKDEFSSEVKFHKPGILAMANSGPNTNGSQFFITVAPTQHLNGKHTIFGEVTAGMDVVTEISKVGAKQDKPVEDVVLKKIEIH